MRPSTWQHHPHDRLKLIALELFCALVFLRLDLLDLLGRRPAVVALIEPERDRVLGLWRFEDRFVTIGEA